MGRYINPFTDWGFKKIFGQEANKDILIFFLNELLKGERVIEDLSFLDKEQLGSLEGDRSMIYDVYCLTDTGEYIIVEMQNKKQPNFLDRSLYYLSRSVVAQSERGSNWAYKVSAVYGVFFMNFPLVESLGEKLRTDIILADRDSGRMVCDKMRFVMLQLPFFHKSEDECENDFERMIYVLKKMDALSRMPFEKRNFIFERLGKIAEVRKLTKDEQVMYDRSLKKYRDTLNVFRGAIEEGREQGLAEGREQGLAEGRAEQKLAIARKMKEAGLDTSMIMTVTGLSAEDMSAI